jgi:hypothetical protein
MEFISQILELRCGKYWFWSFFFFFAGNSNKLQNLGLQGKISWTLNVLRWWNLKKN